MLRGFGEIFVRETQEGQAFPLPKVKSRCELQRHLSPSEDEVNTSRRSEPKNSQEIESEPLDLVSCNIRSSFQLSVSQNGSNFLSRFDLNFLSLVSKSLLMKVDSHVLRALSLQGRYLDLLRLTQGHWFSFSVVVP